MKKFGISVLTVFGITIAWNQSASACGYYDNVVTIRSAYATSQLLNDTRQHVEAAYGVSCATRHGTVSDASWRSIRYTVPCVNTQNEVVLVLKLDAKVHGACASPTFSGKELKVKFLRRPYTIDPNPPVLSDGVSNL